jgi:hypothetical protein
MAVTPVLGQVFLEPIAQSGAKGALFFREQKVHVDFLEAFRCAPAVMLGAAGRGPLATRFANSPAGTRIPML